MDKCRKSIPYIRHFILSKYWQHPVQKNYSRKKTGCHRPHLSSSVKHLNTNKCKWHTPPVRLLDVNYISMHNSCKYPNQSRGHQDVSHCLYHKFRCLFLLVNIFEIEWDRNIIITVIADHLSYAIGREGRVYFSFTNWKQRPNGHVTAATAHPHVNSVAALALELCLSYHHLLTHAIIPILSIGLKSVDLCNTFNPAWSSKVFYIKLITNSMTLSDSFIAF